MKPTPVTRREQFLYALGAIQTLTPITREEMYLGNLCGQNNLLPLPVTRYEQYLFKMNGGDINVPTPVTRLEMFLYRACDIEYETPEPVTREEIYWDEYIKEYVTVKTLTGTLPLTFTTSETALRSWTIYGNNTPHNYSASGTLPLTFTTHTAGAVDTWTIYGNDDNGTENLAENVEQGTWDTRGFVKLNTTTRCRVGNIIDVVGSQQYTMYLECPSHNGRLNIQFKNDDGVSKGETGWKSVGEGGSYTTTIPSDATKITIILSIDAGSGNCTPANFTNVMFVKGSTAPDHFIPYQQGVGERTANLFDYSQGCDWVPGSNGESNQKITAQQGNVFTVKSTSALYAAVRGYGANDERISSSGWSTDGTSTYTAPVNIAYVKVVFRNFDYSRITAEQKATISEAMLVKGSTAPTTYIPYGYQIPITVSQTGQSDKTVDIYIGDAPLTAGQSISKTSTGVDLELFEGENTVSTMLYNKPETSITYTDYLGVGEYVNGQWQIPLTLSHITDNLFDKDATDTDNGYEDDTRTYWRQAIYGLRLFIEPNADYCTSEYIPVTAGTDYYPSDVDISIEALFSATFYTAEKTLIHMAFSSADKITAPENAAYIRVCVEKSKLNSAMLTTKPTSEYIPHKQSTDYTIPIDAPLTEGQSVSDTVEITAYEGENTIDTTLYNKPTMTITYK